MSRVVSELEALRKSEWRHFLWKKHKFMSILAIIFLIIAIVNLIYYIVPSWFVDMSIYTADLRTEVINEERWLSFLIFIVIGLMLSLFVAFKYIYYYEIYKIAIPQSTFYETLWIKYFKTGFEEVTAIKESEIPFEYFIKSGFYNNGTLEVPKKEKGLNLYHSPRIMQTKVNNLEIIFGNVVYFEAMKQNNRYIRLLKVNTLFALLFSDQYLGHQIFIRKKRSTNLIAKTLHGDEHNFGEKQSFKNLSICNYYDVYSKHPIADLISSEFSNALLHLQKLDVDVEVSINGELICISAPEYRRLLHPKIYKKITEKNLNERFEKLKALMYAIEACHFVKT